MKAEVDCIPCMFKQALNTARVVTDDPDVHREILAKVAERVAGLELSQTPAAMSQPAYKIVSEVTGVSDPYESAKAESNRIAMQLSEEFEEWVELTDDSLDAALHIAAAGNVIDLGAGHKFDIEEDVRELMAQPFAVSSLDKFRAELKPGKKLLYLGDNAGEIVFDCLLVKQLLQHGVDVIFTVKSGPIINDATMRDANDVGMTDLVKVIETGGADIGVDWSNISDEFRAAFESADIIISKGHGNFETCNDRSENIYFLLKAKCELVADMLDVKLGDIVFK
ncbi:MAG: DUF89 family protein [Kiritimatiellae bacterium]|nr:DUF89 family protein [Kiritimatiellia bacterium]